MKIRQKSRAKTGIEKVVLFSAALMGLVPGIVSAEPEKPKPITYFAYKDTPYVMQTEDGKVSPLGFAIDDYQMPFVPDKSGKWFNDKDGDNIKDLDEEYMLSEFNDEARKLLKRAREEFYLEILRINNYK